MQITDVLIHVSERLDKSAQSELEKQFRNLEGVIAPRFSSEKDNFLFVSYNSDVVDSTTLIDKVRENGLEAQLIGL